MTPPRLTTHAKRRCSVSALHFGPLMVAMILMLGPSARSRAEAAEPERSAWPRQTTAPVKLRLETGGQPAMAVQSGTARNQFSMDVVRASNEVSLNRLRSSMPQVDHSSNTSAESSTHAEPEGIPAGVPVPEPEGSLSLPDLESIALENNPTLVQAAARVQAAQGRWTQGGLRPNPIVGYQASEVGNEGRAGQQGAFLSQEFVRGGKLALNQTIASQEIGQFRQRMELQRLRVLNDVRIEYFNVLIAQRLLTLARELLEISDKGLTTTQSLFKGKEISNAEVIQARIESASAAVALRNANNRYATAWRRLTSVIGVPTLAPRHLVGELKPDVPEIAWDEAYTRLVVQSPELSSARFAVARARAIVERAQVEPIPNVDVQLGVQYDNASEYMIGNIQLGVPIPFANRNQGNVQTAYADLRDAQADVGRIELDLRNRLALMFETYSNARNNVEAFSKQILPDAKSSLDLYNTKFLVGDTGYLAVLTAQRTFFQVNVAYLESLREFNTSRIAIEGLMLTGSLQGGAVGIDMPSATETIAPVFGPGRPPVERN